jgi:sensor histidine kinase YesM
LFRLDTKIIGNICIFNREGQLFYKKGEFEEGLLESIQASLQENNLTNVQTIKHNNVSYSYTVLSDESDKWILMNIIPMSSITRSWNMIRYMGIGIGIVAFFLAFLFSKYMSDWLSNNINILLERINKIASGKFKEHVHLNSLDEMSVLAQRLNELGDEMDRLITKSINEEKIKQELELKLLKFQYNALQSQINPHFMYNALESISSMATIKGIPEISDIVCKFASLLRRNVAHQNRYITIKDEMDYIRDYLNIFSYVYPSKLKVNIVLEKQVNDFIVPSLIIQPIVENCIVHAAEKMTSKTYIKIRCALENGKFCISIKDNGPGMDENEIEGLLLYDKQQVNEDKKDLRVGISSVNRRIKLLFGVDYGIQIQSKHNQYTLVKIFLPCLSSSPEEMKMSVIR